jgi:hypothetical protein
VSSTNDTGNWYLVYKQDDLVGKAINKEVNFDNYCPTCNAYSKRYKDLLLINQVKNSGDLTSMFNVDSNAYITNTNFGINIRFSLYCDYTDFIIQQKSLFIDAINLQFALNFMTSVMNTTRLNMDSLNLGYNTTQLQFELYGSKGNVGIVKQLEAMLKDIKLNLAGLSKICKPCRKTGIYFSN